jgi:hypothetical protein
VNRGNRRVAFIGENGIDETPEDARILFPAEKVPDEIIIDDFDSFHDCLIRGESR